MMLRDDIYCDTSVNAIAPRLGRLAEMGEFVATDHTLLDEVLLNGPIGIRPFGEPPIDVLCLHDGDPVYLCGGKPCLMCGIVDRGNGNELRLRSLGVLFRWCSS